MQEFKQHTGLAAPLDAVPAPTRRRRGTTPYSIAES